MCKQKSVPILQMYEFVICIHKKSLILRCSSCVEASLPQAFAKPAPHGSQYLSILASCNGLWTYNIDFEPCALKPHMVCACVCVCVCVCAGGWWRHIPCWSVVGMHMVTCSWTAPLCATLTYLKQYPGERSWNRLQSKCTDEPTFVTRCSPKVNNNKTC